MTINLTPAMRQYVDIKSRHRDCLLFFRMGDFYEMFFEDAIAASRLLDIALTSRDKDSQIPMCGIPVHARNAYLSKLVRQGRKVAICEQIEEEGGKGIFRREVVEVVTPGLVFNDECLDSRGNNYLAAIRLVPPFAYAALDATTGEFFHEACPSEDALCDALYRIAPAEFVSIEGEGEPGSARATALLSGKLRSTLSRVTVDEFALPASIEGVPAEGHHALGVVRSALCYLQIHQPRALAEITRAEERVGSRFLALDEVASRTLELFSTLSGDRKGSLLWAVDRTRSPMGARRLRDWIARPLVDVAAISARHDAVGALVDDLPARADVASALDGMGDLSRLATRLAQDRSGPRDVAALRDALARLPLIGKAVSAVSSALLANLASSLGDHSDSVDRISGAFRDELPATWRDGGIFRDGVDPRLDELNLLLTHGEELLAKMEAKERERTGVPSLKIRFNRVFGYYIEITKAHAGKAPADYVRKQTTVNGERFITPELKEYEAKALRAEEDRNLLEEELFVALRDALKATLPAIHDAADAVGSIDALLSFADLAASERYARPVIDSGRGLVIENGRHPVVERILGRHAFVPNDCRLSPDGTQVAILTGPNMAGKSTYIRQVALIVLLAQAGSFVPAEKASIGLCDRIFTRIGASDDLSRGESTFMVEMKETARILSGVTDRTLVVLDEVGRGTSTYDGLSIAWAVAEFLHDSPKRPKVLFATHYHELTDLTQTADRAENLHVAVREWQGEIIFLRRIDHGPASKSYGIQVARLAGLPESVIERAREVLKNLETSEYNEFGLPSLSGRRSPAGAAPTRQLDLFSAEKGRAADEETVLEEIRRAEIDKLAPLDALIRLVSWKERIRKGSA